MENGLLYRKPPAQDSLADIVSPQNAPLALIRFGVTLMRAETTLEVGNAEDEFVLVLLGGKLLIKTENAEFILSRTSVFTEKASATYIPPGCAISITALEESELAVIGTRPKARKTADKPLVVTPDKVTARTVGKQSWRRTVHDIITPDFPAGIPLIGETFNEPGKWSSSPPHKHDRDNAATESQHEEIYYYRTDPQQGFGIQRIYSEEDGLDECHAVRHGDVIVIPRGYHPVVAAPGYQLYYLWILAGQSRNAKWAEDPAHNWIHLLQDGPGT